MQISPGGGVLEPADATHPSKAEASLYGWVVVHERMDVDAAAAELELTPGEVEEALESLLARRLVHRSARDPSLLRAVDPDLLAAVATSPIEERIRNQRRLLEEVRDRFAGLREHYINGLSQRNALIEVIPRVDEVRVALNRASAQCRGELLTSQPGGSRNPEVLADALARDTALLRRGVRMRTLYHHTARFNGPSQSYVAAVSALGAQYRTAHELFGRLIVYDREVAFIPEAAHAWGAVLIREPSIVRYLCDIFEQTWSLAQPFSDAALDGLEAVSKDIDRTIVKLMGAGLKDETIARRLGMSLRSVRRHIADIMESTGAESRFQLGVLLTRQGILDPDTA
ncbi:helix-turn-helix transcriptional regulator [Streptomyces sp. AHA2]|uniref:helix-turn-helix transcriptional regulator n=1 Tax=Streptomyces sp. AHA2 TaxID=3064526 RepID=UPI002FE23AD3